MLSEHLDATPEPSSPAFSPRTRTPQPVSCSPGTGRNVARWMAAAHTGLGSAIAPAGVYVCGSLKEEFGLALIEALAAGVVVVGPDAGGTATYVDDGATGFLVDTGSPRAIAAGMSQALDLARDPGAAGRVQQARRLVRERYTIQAMARTLTAVYAGITGPSGTRSPQNGMPH